MFKLERQSKSVCKKKSGPESAFFFFANQFILLVYLKSHCPNGIGGSHSLHSASDVREVKFFYLHENKRKITLAP